MVIISMDIERIICIPVGSTIGLSAWLMVGNKREPCWTCFT